MHRANPTEPTRGHEPSRPRRSNPVRRHGCALCGHPTKQLAEAFEVYSDSVSLALELEQIDHERRSIASATSSTESPNAWM